MMALKRGSDLRDRIKGNHDRGRSRSLDRYPDRDRICERKRHRSLDGRYKPDPRYSKSMKFFEAEFVFDFPLPRRKEHLDSRLADDPWPPLPSFMKKFKLSMLCHKCTDCGAVHGGPCYFLLVCAYVYEGWPIEDAIKMVSKRVNNMKVHLSETAVVVDSVKDGIRYQKSVNEHELSSISLGKVLMPAKMEMTKFVYNSSFLKYMEGEVNAFSMKRMEASGALCTTLVVKKDVEKKVEEATTENSSVSSLSKLKVPLSVVLENAHSKVMGIDDKASVVEPALKKLKLPRPDTPATSATSQALETPAPITSVPPSFLPYTLSKATSELCMQLDIDNNLMPEEIVRTAALALGVTMKGGLLIIAHACLNKLFTSVE